MAGRIENPTSGPPHPDPSVELPPSSPSSSRPPVTNVILVGQQLAQALGPARALVNRISEDPKAAVEELRGWYARQHPAERDRLLWQCFLEAEQTYEHLERAIQGAREAFNVEQRALAQVEAERHALAAQPLPTTVEDVAAEARIEPVRRYQALGLERDARQTAIAELERLLSPTEQTLSLLAEATVRLLKAVVTIDREVFVGRLRESGELEHLRSRFERLRTMANTHAAEIDEWSQRVNRPVRVPRVVFPWPSAAIWDGLLAEGVEAPQLVLDDDPNRPGG